MNLSIDEFINSVTIEIAGETLCLLGDKALYWPANNTLFIADIHFGKDASFRALAVPIPSGTTQHDVLRLNQLITLTQPTKIVFLGDFFHARTSQQTAVLNTLLSWRNLHSQIELILVRGNHDSHAGDPPAQLNIHCVDEPYVQPPFVYCHHPQASNLGYVLAGHVHPVKKIYGRGKQSLRLPCFYFTQQFAILPAFGSFTGGYNIEPQVNSTVYLIADQQVIAMPF